MDSQWISWQSDLASNSEPGVVCASTPGPLASCSPLPCCHMQKEHLAYCSHLWAFADKWAGQRRTEQEQGLWKVNLPRLGLRIDNAEHGRKKWLNGIVTILWKIGWRDLSWSVELQESILTGAQKWEGRAHSWKSDLRAKHLWTQFQPTTDYFVGPGQILHSAMTVLNPCWEGLSEKFAMYLTAGC